LAVNSLWLQWPITWALFVASTLLALYGDFSIESVIEGCVVTVIVAIPLVIVLWILDPLPELVKIRAFDRQTSSLQNAE